MAGNILRQPLRRESGGALIELALLSSIVFGLLVTTLTIGLPKRIKSLEDTVEAEQGIILTGLDTSRIKISGLDSSSLVELGLDGELVVLNDILDDTGGGGTAPPPVPLSVPLAPAPPSESNPDPIALQGLDHLLEALAEHPGVSNAYATIIDLATPEDGSSLSSSLYLAEPAFRSSGEEWIDTPSDQCRTQLLEEASELSLGGVTGNSLSMPFALGVCLQTEQGEFLAAVRRITVGKWFDADSLDSYADSYTGCYLEHPYTAEKTC